jgi:hypothetical protein
MKNIKKSFITYILIFISITTIISCFKNDSQFGNKPEKKIFKEQLFGKSFIIKNSSLFYNTTSQSDFTNTGKTFTNNHEFYEEITMPVESLQEFFTFLSTNINGLTNIDTSKIYRINIFLSEGDSIPNLRLENITGVSIFLLNANSLTHKVFHVKSGIADKDNEEEKIEGEFQDFSSAAIRGVGKYLNNDNFATATLHITRDFSLDFENDTQIPDLTSLIYNSDKIAPEYFLDDESGLASCKGCGSNATTGCKWVKDHNECKAIDVCKIAKLNSLNIDYNLGFPSLDEESARIFRDNFMMTSTVRRKYINYYYFLSEFLLLKNLITTSNFNQNFDLALKCYELKNIILNGQNSDIVITNDFRSKALEVISYYRNSTTNEKILSIFSDIENDLSNFAGLTRIQLIDATND